MVRHDPIGHHDYVSEQDAPDPLTWLQAWYATQCDGDWEHDYGVSIQTLDNPGWHLSVDLTETALAKAQFDPIRIERSAGDFGEVYDELAEPVGV